MRPERGLGYIIFFHGYLMIARGQINGGKVFSFSQSVQQVIDARQWIAVLDRLFVQSPIVNAHAPLTVLLRNKEDRGAVRALRWSDVSLRQQILNLPGAPHAPWDSICMEVCSAGQHLARF